MIPLAALAFVMALLAAASGASATGDGLRPLPFAADLASWWGAPADDSSGWTALAPEELAERRAATREAVRDRWRLEDGVLACDGAGPVPTTAESFGDLEVVVELRVAPGAEAGLRLRGGLATVRAEAGTWHRLRARLAGERATLWRDGEPVLEHARLSGRTASAPLPRRGPIQLLARGGEVRWRGVAVRELGPGESRAILAAAGDAGFRSVFDGESLAGWRGDLEGWEVRGGALRCRPGRSATIFTAEEHGDFAARFEFRLPPGGNNGVAVRYPGHGDPAYSGMCELQVLDDGDPRYAGLDPRQRHGSAYGQVAAHPGYLRPAGEWNFQEIVVRGRRVRVELNGTRILDADLAEERELMYPAERFAGRGRSRGHLGFAGHGDPVEFRAVRVRAD